jgi:hypothetical protein
MTPTIYSDIYSVFQSQLSDPVFNASTVRDDLSKQYLINSIPKFRRCLQDLNNRSDTNSVFNIELINDEKQILANLMVVEYLSPQIIKLQLLEKEFTSKDFAATSSANQLEKLQLIRKERQIDISKMIVDYTYNFSDLTKLK